MRHRLFAVLTLIVVLLTCSGCSSFTSGSKPITLPSIIPATMEAVCGLYGKIKPLYPEIKAYVIANRDDIEKRVPGAWNALETIDKHAADLDRGLSLLCAAPGDQNAQVITAEKSRVPWDKVGSAVVKLATVAIQVYGNK